MPFPEAPRFIYENNPLVSVICQLRFPTILKIDTEIPSEFQELIRNQFSIYRENIEFGPDIPSEIISQIPAEARELLPQGTKKNFEFLSDDQTWKINLTNNFIALTCKNYHRWEEFREQFEIPYQALLQVYKPKIFTRIGLRYRNIIKRSRIDLKNVLWSELLQPHILGTLLAPGIKEPDILSTLSNVVIQLADQESVVRIVHGLVQDKNEDELSYMIDSDFFSEKKTELENAMVRLDFFHQRGQRLIRWCITDRLHTALDPKPI